MYVIKRNGRQESRHIHKITARWKKLRYALNPEDCEAVLATQKVCAAVDELAAETAAIFTTKHPHYAQVATGIVDSNLHKNTKISFSKMQHMTDPNVRTVHMPLFNFRLLSLHKRLLESTLASFGNKRMASTVSPLQVPAGVEEKSNGSDANSVRTAKVVFVLGGPGSGKGTQCALIVKHFGFTHLSAGDLLRDEINSGNENGVMIQNTIKEGKIVPSEVTVRLLQKAMCTSGNNKFLIDGFPRNDENRATFDHVTGLKPEFVLFFNCTEAEMERRILRRNQGRVDDNIQTIRKRFKVFVDSSLPVVSYYDACGKVRRVDADRTREEVFEAVRPLFVPFAKEEA